MPRQTRRSEFAAGGRAQLPLLLGVAPFGMAYGAYAVKSGLSPALAQSMSAIVFAGASQFVAVRLIVDSVPGAIVVLTVALVNLRHLLYSAALAPHVEHLERRWRWLLAYLLTDEAYAIAVTRYRRSDASPYRHWFFLARPDAPRIAQHTLFIELLWNLKRFKFQFGRFDPLDLKHGNVVKIIAVADHVGSITPE